jgi:hypothetical protein
VAPGLVASAESDQRLDDAVRLAGHQIERRLHLVKREFVRGHRARINLAGLDEPEEPT